MGNFKRGGNRGGGFRGGNGGGKPGFRGGDRGRGQVEMFKAVCDQCHKTCEVPFRPSGDKPIYCNECFGGKKGNEDRGGRRGFGDRGGKKDFNDRPARSFDNAPKTDQGMNSQIKDLNAKLDRILTILEKNAQVKVETKVEEKKEKTITKVPEAKKVVSKESKTKKPLAKKTLTKATEKKVVTKKKK